MRLWKIKLPVEESNIFLSSREVILIDWNIPFISTKPFVSVQIVLCSTNDDIMQRESRKIIKQMKCRNPAFQLCRFCFVLVYVLFWSRHEQILEWKHFLLHSKTLIYNSLDLQQPWFITWGKKGFILLWQLSYHLSLPLRM